VPIHPLTSSQTPVFLLNSRLSLFTASTLRWNPFSQSYGVILPSSLARVLSNALVSSTHLPVSVCGTGTLCTPYEVFLVSVKSPEFGPYGPPHHTSALTTGGFAYLSALVLGCRRPSRHSDYPPASPLQSTHTRWCWNINQLSISYALRPRLRPD
jgi:hypothetical protein